MLLRRTIPNTNLAISPVALGCWPMAGISSLEVDDRTSQLTVEAALAVGINHFDTAFSYGYDGRSDRILASALKGKTSEVVLASKVGSHYTTDHKRVLDSTPSRLIDQAAQIRRRLSVDMIDILYLHAPDGKTPIEQCAETLASLRDRGWIRYVGLSNASLEEVERFATIVPPVLLQPPFNMLQQGVLRGLYPAIDAFRCGVAAYWPLMKGLLAGKYNRDWKFSPEDRRLSYPMYTGVEWQRNQDFLDRLRAIAEDIGWTVARLVVRWTMEQRGVTTVLCGAKRPEQIIETAEAMQGELPPGILSKIDAAIKDRCLTSPLF